MTKTFTLPHFPALFTGIDVQVPVLDGSHQRYINLDNAASTPPFKPHREVVLTSGMEPHSNALPWRAVANVIHIRLHPDGRLDEADFDTQLVKYSDRVALVAISGASNGTGYLNPIDRLAEKAHATGAQIAVDCAQLAPHRRGDMRSLEDPAHLDYVALSAHKLSAPS